VGQLAKGYHCDFFAERFEAGGQLQGLSFEDVETEYTSQPAAGR
jgi:alpha-acetolactate decarboxylase